MPIYVNVDIYIYTYIYIYHRYSVPVWQQVDIPSFGWPLFFVGGESPGTLVKAAKPFGIDSKLKDILGDKSSMLNGEPSI